MPTRMLQAQAETGESRTQGLHPHRSTAGRPHLYISRGTQMNAMSPTRRVRWSSLHKRDPNFGIVHANCIKFIRIVDERQRQLKLRLKEQQQTAIDVAQMFELERAQLKAKIRRLSLENQAVLDEFRKVREQVVSLQQQLDGANTDVQNRIIRKELEQAIHFTLSSVIQTVARIIGESQIE